MKKTLITMMLASVATLAFSQLNMTLMDQIDYQPDANDIWGWVDPDDGTEYALVGLIDAVSIVDLTDPSDVFEVIRIPGPESTWRDIKTWGHHIYVTNETSNGVLVIDMTGAPNNITSFEWMPNLPGLGQLNRCHNLYIDEFGYCYLTGCNLNNGGMLIVDVFSDPGNPQYVSAAPNTYSHDVFVRGNVMYASEINQGRLALYDVSDKDDITLINTQNTPFNFTHNAWLNDASTVVFTTDEKANAPVAAYDITDPTDIFELDQYTPIETLGDGVIPHNVHVWEDWLIISYYSDGGIIVDASRPENLIEVGNWDTFFGGGTGFQGVWGAYPFLPSGLVLLTDIGTGLYVCDAEYVRACWLEGKVTNELTGNPVFNAEIVINSTQANLANSDLVGNYESGLATAGTYDVDVSAPGYFPKTVQATLENGELTILDIQLEPFLSFDISGQCVLESDGSPLPGVTIFLDGDVDFKVVTDNDGNFFIDDVFIGDYTFHAGGWGFHTVLVNGDFTVDAFAGGPHIIEMTVGYKDEFAVDLGWTVSGDANVGVWERGEPVGTFFGGGFSNTGEDIQGDLGDQCYVTGNGGGGAGNDDVDNGTTTLTSPVMDLTTYFDPILSYNAWFLNDGGGNGSGPPNDALSITISNGIETVTVEEITTSLGAWRPATSFRLLDYLAITDNMQVVFETSDFQGSGHLVEAAVDVFIVTDNATVAPFSATETSGCLPHTVEFADQSDSTATYVWIFEGGTPAISTDAKPTVEYNTLGIFDVTLEITTTAGNVFVIERPDFVNINMTPVASFDATIAGNELTLSNTSMGNSDYTWNFGDGTVSNEDAPSHTYDDTGSFTVTLTATNNCGTDTEEFEINVGAVPPNADFSASETDGCTPFSVEFADESEGEPTAWEWTFLGGTPPISNEQNPLVVYNTPGTWSVLLKVTNAAGESFIQESTLITVAPSPQADFSHSSNGPIVDFLNGSSNGDSYLWDFGDGTTSTEQNPAHTFLGIGEYEVTLTVTNECGFAAFTQEVVIDNASAVGFLDETAFQLSVVPNPFSSQFKLDYQLSGIFNDAQVVVYNVLGQQLTTAPLATTNGSVVMGDELTHSGVYFIRLVVDGKMGKAVRVVRM